MATLDYENPVDAALPRIALTPDGGVAVTVPTQRNAARFIGAFAEAHVFALVGAPLLWVIFMLFATRKPRAILSLTPKKLILTEWNDDGLGLFARTRTWPSNEIGELRKNRYDRGLWLTIRGRDSMNLLEDVPGDALCAVSEALIEARQRLAK